MKTYAIYGESLGSELDFPQLRPVHVTSPRWVLREDAPCVLPDDAMRLGADEVNASSRVTLFRSRDGLHLVFDDTGRFDLHPNGRDITWRAAEHASRESARMDVTGRVLAAALHHAGELCFHASAVALGSVAVAFLGAKGAGKSTLAWALVRAGAKLITDDTLRVQAGDPPSAFPGLHELRLRDDAAHRLPPEAHAATRTGDRLNVHALEADRLQHDAVSLSALYVLAPVQAGHASEGRVQRIPDAHAAIALVRHAKIAPLLAGDETLKLIDRIVSLVRHTPVYLLEVPRDFSAIERVVALLQDRHAAMGEPAA